MRIKTASESAQVRCTDLGARKLEATTYEIAVPASNAFLTALPRR
jgi:hypothetical protein